MMNVDDLTIKQWRELVAIFGGAAAPQVNNGMIGKYVIVRCRDAGVHAGILESHNGRECVISGSRRLWYWKVVPGHGDFLEAIANGGVHPDSKIGPPCIRKHLTENCEITECTDAARRSIEGAAIYGE